VKPSGFHVVVLVARDDVEHHAAELLLQLPRRQLEAAHREQRLLVGVSAREVEVEVRERPERLLCSFRPSGDRRVE